MNSTKELVKIIEIGPEEIRYKRTSNPDGPVFVKLKSWIHHICFENGDVQTMSNATNPKQVLKFSDKSELRDLVFDNNILYYKAKPLGDGKLKVLIQNYPDADKKTKMHKEFDKMVRYRKGQYLWGSIGPGVGGIILFISFGVLVGQAATPVPTNTPYAALGIAAGGTIFFISLNQSQLLKKKRIKQKQKIAEIYNSR